MTRYLILAACILFAGYAQAAPRHDVPRYVPEPIAPLVPIEVYQCTYVEDGGPRVIRIQVYEGHAVESSWWAEGGKFQGNRIYKELENTDRSYVAGALWEHNNDARWVSYETTMIDKRTLEYASSIVIPTASNVSKSTGTCMRQSP